VCMNFPLYFRFCLSILAVLLTSCDPCENLVLQEKPAPNGAQKAVVFQRQCGILGGTSTQVSVLPASAQAFAGGNVFGADANADQSLKMLSGGPPIAVKWLGEQELQIAYDARVRVFQSEEMLGDVTISYNAQTAPEPTPTDSSPKRNKK
jgi:hypothetical protein